MSHTIAITDLSGITFVAPDARVRDLAEREGAQRELYTADRFRASVATEHHRVRQGAHRQIRDLLQALAVLAPNGHRESTIAAARGRSATFSKVDAVDEVMRHLARLIPPAEGAWRRVEIVAGLGARDGNGAPIFRTPVEVTRLHPALRRVLVLAFLREHPEALR